MIDTLKLARRLEEAGMERRQAEALAEGIKDGLEAEVVSRGHFDARLDAFEAQLNARLAALEAQFNARLAALEAQIDARLAAFEAQFTARLDAQLWRITGAVAVMLLAHLALIWGILATRLP